MLLTDGGGQKGPYLKSAHMSYNDQIWQRYTLPKKGSNIYMNHVTYPFIFADFGIFSLEIIKFCRIRKYRYRLHFGA